MSTGYGTEVYCYDEIRTGRLVSGPEVVAQALYRRFTTSRGSLAPGYEDDDAPASDDDDLYGLDLQDFIGTVGTVDAVAALPDVIRAEALKDDRVVSCDVTVDGSTGSDGMVALTIAINAELHNAGDSFTLTLAVSDVTTELLGFKDTSQ